MKQKHQDEQCPKIKLPCFNQCGLTVTREDMDRHIGQDCANAESTCPYEFGACAYEVYYFFRYFIHICTVFAEALFHLHLPRFHSKFELTCMPFLLSIMEYLSILTRPQLTIKFQEI